MSYDDKLKKLVSEMGKISADIGEVKSKADSSLIARVEAIENSFKSLTLEVTKFMEEVGTKVGDIEHKFDNLEQYSRRNCLVVHGVAENQNENVVDLCLTLFKEKLNLQVPMVCIDRAHRLGKQKVTATNVLKNGSRPIIVKFTGYHWRYQVFGMKKLLKGTKVLISESLTAKRLQLLLTAKEKFGQRNVWSSDGKIVVASGNRKYYLTSLHELHGLPIPDTETVINKESNQNRILRSNSYKQKQTWK